MARCWVDFTQNQWWLLGSLKHCWKQAGKCCYLLALHADTLVCALWRKCLLKNLSSSHLCFLRCHSVKSMHFTNNYSIVSEIWRKIVFIVRLHIAAKFFTCHDSRVVVSCAKKFIVITSLQMGREENKISIKFEIWWKNRWWNGPQIYRILSLTSFPTLPG